MLYCFLYHLDMIFLSPGYSIGWWVIIVAIYLVPFIAVGLIVSYVLFKKKRKRLALAVALAVFLSSLSMFFYLIVYPLWLT